MNVESIAWGAAVIAAALAVVYSPGLARAARARARTQPRRLSTYGRWRLARAMRRHGVDPAAYLDEVQDDGVMDALDDMPAPTMTLHYTPPKETPMEYETRVVRGEKQEHALNGGGVLHIPAMWHVVAGEYANEGTPDLIVTVAHAVDSDGNDVAQQVAATIRDALAVTEPEPAKPPQRGLAPMLVVVTPSQEAADAFLDQHDTHHLVKNSPVRIVTPAAVDQTLHGLTLGPLDHVVFVPGWEVEFISASNANEESAWHRLTIALSRTFRSVPTWRAQIVQVP